MSDRSRRLLRAGIGVGLTALLISGCQQSLLDPQSARYRDYVSAFYTGLAALQVGDDVRAETELARTAAMVPGEPAGWANWGILHLRQRDFEAAEVSLKRAMKLEPSNDRLYYLLGLVESGKGKGNEALSDYRRAVELNPKNLVATYQLAEEIERQGDANSDAQFEKLMEAIIQTQPDNVAALLELGRVAAKQGDGTGLKRALTAIQQQSRDWPPEVQQQFAALQAAASGPDIRQAALRTTFLRNVMMRLPGFRQNLAAIKPQPGDEAQPFTHFLRMPSPVFTPGVADTGISFTSEAIENSPRWTWAGALALGEEGAPVTAQADGAEVLLANGAKFPFPGGPAKTSPGPAGILGVDFNYDFKTDVVLAGAGGIRFFRQDSAQSFTDVTAATKLPPTILRAEYSGVWAVDIEADGDLDVVAGRVNGPPVVLRNNGDGSFMLMIPFAGISGVRDLVWADLNGDGTPDVALIDAARKLHVFENQRSARFREIAAPALQGEVKALAAADVDHDGVLDLVALSSTGELTRLTKRAEAEGWVTAKIAKIPEAGGFLDGEVRLQAADIDNNGAVDLLLGKADQGHSGGGALVWLGDDKGEFLPAMDPIGPALVFTTADVDSDGRLDLVGLSAEGRALKAINKGTRNYHWQVIRPRAKQAVGDQRINPFGVGGEIEIRSGLLVQLQPITGPQVHFGLGSQERTDVARILWPNGSVRAEFALKADQQVVTEQRLKGSCPFLFAFNGSAMEFVKDAVPWGSAIGLRINNIGTAAIAATEEWYKIGRDQLVPRDGFYDLRITGELWETYYYDHLALMTVDHPAGTEIFTDERFVVPAIKPRIVAVDTPRKIESAGDDQGVDVTATVREFDGKYLDDFGRGQYQGVTRDHFVEVDLGEDVQVDQPLYLIAKGWLHPSDSSVNVAISQGGHEAPRPLSLEVQDSQGRWIVAKANLGFPAGRKKTCLFDLTGLLSSKSHKVRLRTNLEVYWDSIEWAHGRPDVELEITRIAPSTADLRYRGYSLVHQDNQSSPELPDYNHLASTGHPWRDLAGYYTRYGDVRELLQRTDDRYVIMNAGDEIALRFPAEVSPAAGWVRDYVIAGDGWIKDGDYNSTYSQTVLPLPHHDRTTYETRPGRLEEEWVFQHHSKDWQDFHTRYVTPQAFHNSLRGGEGK